MPCAVCWLVNKNVAIGGGTARAIRNISLSDIGPGPDGISPTSPIADAPNEIASAASCSFAIQQIFTLGLITIVACLIFKQKKRESNSSLSRLYKHKRSVLFQHLIEGLDIIFTFSIIGCFVSDLFIFQNRNGRGFSLVIIEELAQSEFLGLFL